MTDTISWHWSFPGGVGGLIATLALSLVFIWYAYARTLRLLSPFWRWILTILRSLLLVGLIVCLASPEMVMTRSTKNKPQRPIAIVVDTSGSMVRPDAHQQTRLAIARQAIARIWESSMKLFTFADKLEPLSGPESLNSFTDPERETHLFSSLRDALSASPQGGWGRVVVFTDGNDTTSDSVEDTGRLFRESQTPLLLAATQTDLQQADFVHLANVNLPPVNTVNTKYPLDVFVRSETGAPHEMTVRVLQKGQTVGETKLNVSPGPHTQKVSFHFSQDTPGTEDYQVELIEAGKPDPTESFYATTQICNRPEIKVLYYAGALSVEYRFVRAAFAEDSAIKIEAAVHVSSAGIRHQILYGDETRAHFDAESFPKSVEELNLYKAVVLVDLLPAQLNEEQTDALLEYVKEGGGVIFLVSNTVVASDFSNSKLEQLLPVVFEPKVAQPDGSGANTNQSAAASLLQQLEQAGNVSSPDDESGDHDAVTPLVQMNFTPDGRAVLGKLGDRPDEKAPMFREYAFVQRAKPGAIVAAEHPSDANTWGKRPLLAMQHFGRGRSAVLATDSIWRWQLTLPSNSHAYQKLWQQMLFWVANQDGHAPEIQLASTTARVGDKVAVTIKLPPQVTQSAANPLVLTALSPDGSSPISLPLTGTGPGIYSGFVTATSGPWMRLEASVGDLNKGMAILNIRSDKTSIEDEHLTPDLASLHLLAAAAGGQVVDAATLDQLPSLDSDFENMVTDRKVTDLWNNKLFFTLLLTLFCVELILRRWLKLL